MKYLWTPQHDVSGGWVTLLFCSSKLSRITICRSIPHLFWIHPNPEMVIKLIENYCLSASLDPIMGLSGVLILKQLVSCSLLGHVVDSNIVLDC